MALGTIAPARQLFTPDALKDILDADFADRGHDITIEVGEWNPEAHRGAARIMIQNGTGELTEPRGHYQPGAWWPLANGDVARPILDNAQRYTIRMHSPAAPDVASKDARAAREATTLVLEIVAAAIRRELAAPMKASARVSWPAPGEMPEGYPAFVLGSFCVLDVVVCNPILDDPYAVITPDSLEVDSSFAFPDGATTSPPEQTVSP